ncbi:hypothetical protein DFH07DRAFT_776099 [Mycena maculata]|uniref:Uncharacterized protein n=1 Tax=Mycena maculata TaxID=230809 RepID=A0AAD7IP16_9AGAR|nr:hypothetical protein DFH07DRAFT_776099 [Mycena maculata]
MAWACAGLGFSSLTLSRSPPVWNNGNKLTHKLISQVVANLSSYRLTFKFPKPIQATFENFRLLVEFCGLFWLAWSYNISWEKRGREKKETNFMQIFEASTAYHHICEKNLGKKSQARKYCVGDVKYAQARFSANHQTGLQADMPGLGFDRHPNPSPSPKKPVCAGASPLAKPKMSLSKGQCDKEGRFEINNKNQRTRYKLNADGLVGNGNREGGGRSGRS